MEQKINITVSSNDFGVICPNCGKPIAMSHYLNKIICPFCGTNIERNVELY